MIVLLLPVKVMFRPSEIRCDAAKTHAYKSLHWQRRYTSEQEPNGRFGSFLGKQLSCACGVTEVCSFFKTTISENNFD